MILNVASRKVLQVAAHKLAMWAEKGGEATSMPSSIRGDKTALSIFIAHYWQLEQLIGS